MELFPALLPCLVFARTTLVTHSKETEVAREKREADSEDNAAVLFSLDPLDNMLPKEEAANGDFDQFEELERFSNVVEAFQEEGENEPRLEKSLLNNFPFNQHHDGSHSDHQGEHGVHHGSEHNEYSSTALDRSASSAPLRDHQGSSNPLRNRLSNRVKNAVANQVIKIIEKETFEIRFPRFGSSLASLGLDSDRLGTLSSPARCHYYHHLGHRHHRHHHHLHLQQGQSGSSFPFGSIANKFRNDEVNLV